jgi:pilus assembly protein FimV
MTQSNLQQQAKQGNPQAIATLLNNTLQPKGITAEVSLNQNCLQIIVEANQVPSQDKLVVFLSKAISNLGISYDLIVDLIPLNKGD